MENLCLPNEIANHLPVLVSFPRNPKSFDSIQKMSNLLATLEFVSPDDMLPLSSNLKPFSNPGVRASPRYSKPSPKFYFDSHEMPNCRERCRLI